MPLSCKIVLSVTTQVVSYGKNKTLSKERFCSIYSTKSDQREVLFFRISMESLRSEL